LLLAGAAAALLGLIGLGTAEFGTTLTAVVAPDGRTLDDLEALAALLFSRYVLPFEAASLLLLATMVAVIVLAKRQRERIRIAAGASAHAAAASEASAEPSGAAR
jgi:NADH-quinone oxidoreductase subunit J